MVQRIVISELGISGYELLKPLKCNYNEVEGYHIVSNQELAIYGEGDTLAEALGDVAISLVDLFQLSEENHPIRDYVSAGGEMVEIIATLNFEEESLAIYEDLEKVNRMLLTAKEPVDEKGVAQLSQTASKLSKIAKRLREVSEYYLLKWSLENSAD